MSNTGRQGGTLTLGLSVLTLGLSMLSMVLSTVLYLLTVSSHETSVLMSRGSLKIPFPLGPCKCPDDACIIGFQNSQAVFFAWTVSPPMQELLTSGIFSFYKGLPSPHPRQ